MTTAIIWGLIGAFVGWNLPQPTWAKTVQSKIMGLLGKHLH